MTNDEKVDVLRRLLAMQQTLRTVMEAVETQGQLCDSAGAKGLAFSVYMLRESLAAYSKELNRWVEGYLAEDDFAAGIE
jgi:hypothetical protein